jgi:hypothetical protein
VFSYYIDHVTDFENKLHVLRRQESKSTMINLQRQKGKVQVVHTILKFIFEIKDSQIQVFSSVLSYNNFDQLLLFAPMKHSLP